jgi:hypothetical protein
LERTKEKDITKERLMEIEKTVYRLKSGHIKDKRVKSVILSLIVLKGV